MARKSNNAALNNLCDRQNSVFLDNKLSKTITYVTGTTGATGATTLATVTGVVAVSVFGVCATSLTAASTIEVGTALSTAGLIAQTTASDIIASEIWHDASPDASVELTSVVIQSIVTQNVIQTIGGTAVTGGVMTYYILWSPISSDGNVVIA